MKKVFRFPLFALALTIMAACSKESEKTPTTEAVDNDPMVYQNLVAYYHFDYANANNDRGRLHNGTLVRGTYISDTPSGSGLAVQLDSGGYVGLGSALYGQRTFTVNLWVKDVKSGPLFTTLYDESHGGPTFAYNGATVWYRYGYNNHSTYFTADLRTKSENRWTMLTFVTDSMRSTTDANRAWPGLHKMYVDGQLVGYVENSQDCEARGYSTVGGSLPYYSSYPYRAEGYPCEPFKVDNVRLYNVPLTDDLIMKIYKKEMERKGGVTGKDTGGSGER